MNNLWRRQFSVFQAMAGITLVCLVLGVFKIVGAETLWKVFVSTSTLALVVHPLRRLYVHWKELD